MKLFLSLLMLVLLRAEDMTQTLSVTQLGDPPHERQVAIAGLAEQRFRGAEILAQSQEAPEPTQSARNQLSCVAWRGVSGCTPEISAEPLDTKLSLPCHATIRTGLAGWCECEHAFRVREVGCSHEIFRCDEQCALHTAIEAEAKTESALRAELSPTDSVVAEFMQEPAFSNEFAPAYIGPLLQTNKPFAIWLLCDCDDDVRWAKPIEEMKKLPEWDAKLKDAFVYGYARTPAIEAFQLLDNFAIEGAPALGIDNIPIGQNMEKYTFRSNLGGQLKWRPEIGQPPPEYISGRELADFFLGFLNQTLPLVVKSSPVPQNSKSLAGATEIVGSNFIDIVMDESKDVAVFFYAPWCGGSNLVRPIIDRAADVVREIVQPKEVVSRQMDNEAALKTVKGRDEVAVVKMDLTVNDIPVRGISVRTYPALWLWPRGRKHSPLEYAAYNHERTDGDGGRHSHYELGMVLDFLTDIREHRVRSVHTEGDYADHLWKV